MTIWVWFRIAFCVVFALMVIRGVMKAREEEKKQNGDN